MPDDDDDELRATYAGAKRRIAALELQLQTYAEAGTKRKSYVIISFYRFHILN